MITAFARTTLKVVNTKPLSSVVVLTCRPYTMEVATGAG
jgi:hypothetical protein